MKPTASRKLKQDETWPRKVTVGRETVSVYRRKTPLGNFAYMVANYAEGKRRFDSHAREAEALDAASKLARQLSEPAIPTARNDKEQSVEYINAIQSFSRWDDRLRQRSPRLSKP